MEANLLFITITADGTRYAFMINDILAFTNYFYNPRFHTDDYDPDLLKAYGSNRNKYYFGNIINGIKQPPLILENSTNKDQDLKYFMEIATNAGLNVFEVDQNFSTFIQIGITNNQLTKKPCN